jgi:dTDP-4-amino-4,6-dideoxygalactose transaminase
MARGWAGRLAELREKRLANAEYWQGVESAGGFRPSFRKQGECYDLLRYPIEVSDGGIRDWLVAEGSRLGLGMAPGYPDSIDGIDELKGDLRGQSYPEAKGLAKRLLTLPVHPLLSARDRNRIQRLLMKKSKGTSPWR